METIYSLLNLNADLLSNFSSQARLIEDKGTERTLNQNIKKLGQIEEVQYSDGEFQMPHHSIEAVVQKILRKALKNSREEISLSELRIVSYNLSQLHGEDKAYLYALNLLNEEWIDLFFNGLVYYLLSSWNNIRNDYKSACLDFFTYRLESYNGAVQRYLKLKENLEFFKDGGPLRLGALLLRKGIDLMEGPTVIGYKQSAFAHSYFSDVIIKYIKDTTLNDIDFLANDVFTLHKEDRTKKLVFANLILDAETRGDIIHQSKISSVAQRVLGDITLSATWAPFHGATDEDISKLKRASELASLWLNRVVIKAFFEVCVQDKARERFWSQYAKEVTGFKIAGSSLIKRSLQLDPRIDSQILNKCFVETNSSTSRTSALVLVFRGKAVVEFSDVGSVYAYNVTNRIISSIINGRKIIDKTDDLKDTSLPILIKDEDYISSIISDEGRLPHIGKWESRLHKWLKAKAFISSNMAVNQPETDSVFKRKPISYSIPKIKETVRLMETPKVDKRKVELKESYFIGCSV